MNKALKAAKCTYEITSIKIDDPLSTVTVKATKKKGKLQTTKSGKLKGVKYVHVTADCNGVDKTFKLSTKQYTATLVDVEAGTVQITGKGKIFTGTVTVTID